MASHLGVSQGRLSQLERGEGSFTAEQFLTVLELFNVGASEFVVRPTEPGAELQNVLARLGAGHLQESSVLPSERIEEVNDAVRETLVSADAARLVTALAPVLIIHSDSLNLHKLEMDLRRIGLAHRLTWLIENILCAIDLARPLAIPRLQRARRRARAIFESYLETAQQPETPERSPDLLDANIRSTQTRLQVQAASSDISKRRQIVTAIQPTDFVTALEAALAD